MLGRLAIRLTVWAERCIPGAMTIAVVLTLLTMVGASVATDTSPLKVVQAWGDGFWALVPFAMQMVLVVVSGFLVASAPPVDRLMARLAARARSPRGAVVLMAAVSMALAWVHWGLSLVGCAMLVRHMVRAVPSVDYRLLVCAAYFGMGATWHAGLSASAPLLVATPGHFLEQTMGVVPMRDTVFSAFNLSLTAIVVMLLLGLVWGLHPAPEHTRPAPPGTVDQLARFTPPAQVGNALAARLDHHRALPLVIALCGAVWLGTYAVRGSGGLTLDVLNFAFLMLAVGLHPSVASLMAAAEQGAPLAAGVILQFPFYAGMYGVIQGTGLATLMGEAIAQSASAESLPLLLYWYSGLVNYLVPSGGSKWAIEAPYLVDAALRLGVPLPQVVLSYAWGDMATDLIQPFWALPLLAAARIDFRDILGYASLVFVAYTLVVSVAFWLWPRLM
ncbi:MAG: short-chain fatty acid transporter [Acidobacteria bacterium]|jgi:short-chain fatty acids transporter|nr:short-chain fatty acid transporter [Acidobacteriota bacterium]